MGAEQSSGVQDPENNTETNIVTMSNSTGTAIGGSSVQVPQSRIESKKLQMKEFPQQYGKIELNLHTESMKQDQKGISQSVNSNLRSTGPIPQKHLSQRQTFPQRANQQVLNSQQLLLPTQKVTFQGDPYSDVRAKRKANAGDKKRVHLQSLSSAQYVQKVGKQSKVTSVQVVGGSRPRLLAMNQISLEKQGHSKQASQVVLDNDVIDLENEGNADQDAEENLDGQNDQSNTHFVQMRSIRALTRSPRDNVSMGHAAQFPGEPQHRKAGQDRTENAKWLNYEDPEIDDDEENQIGRSSGGSDDRTQNLDQLQNPNQCVPPQALERTAKGHQRLDQGIQQVHINGASFLGKRYSNYQQHKSEQNTVTILNQNHTLNYFNRQGGIGDATEANIVTEESAISHQPYFRQNQRNLSGKKGNIQGLMKPQQLDGRQGLNSAQSRHQQKQQQAPNSQRRQTRIKSLYATTTQDLTLDLNKINEDLRSGVDSGGKETKKSGSFKQSRPQEKERVQSTTRQKNYFNEGNATRKDFTQLGSQMVASDQDQVIKSINQSQSHQFIGGTKKTTNISSTKLDQMKNPKSTRKSPTQGIQEKGTKKKLSVLLQKAGSQTKAKSKKTRHSLERNVDMYVKKKFISPDKVQRSGANSFVNGSSDDRGIQKSPEQKRGERGTSLAQFFDKIAGVVTNIAHQPDDQNRNQESNDLYNRLDGPVEHYAGSNSKIQDIKQSSSKLTMAAQLQKYKQDPQNHILPQGCYSPQFQKPQLVYPVTVTNEQVYSRRALHGSFHPKTVKNSGGTNIAKMFGDFTETTEAQEEAKEKLNDLSMNQVHRRGGKPGVMPKSARGLTESRSMIYGVTPGFQQDTNEPAALTAHRVPPAQKDTKTITKNVKGNNVNDNEQTKQVEYQSHLKSIKEQVNEQANKQNKRRNNERLSFMEQISERFEELIDFNKDQGHSLDTTKNNQNQFQNSKESLKGQDHNLIGSIQSSQVNKSQIQLRERKQNAHTPSQILEQGRRPVDLSLQLDSLEDLRKVRLPTDHYNDMEELDGQSNYRQGLEEVGGHSHEARQNVVLSAPSQRGENDQQIDKINMQDLMQEARPQEHLEIEMQQTIDFNRKKQTMAQKQQQVKNNREQNNASIATTRGPTGNNIKISDAVKKHQKNNKNKQSQQSNPLQSQQEAETLKFLPFNGCSCNLEGDQQKKGCLNSQKWIRMAWKEDNYQHQSNYKMYQLYIEINDKSEKQVQIDQDITMDLDRTFQNQPYFTNQQIKDSLKRILIAFSNYEPQVGYVQGMNFVAAVLLFHAGEVAAFWLLCALMEKYDLRHVLSQGLPGLPKHDEEIEALGRKRLPALFAHFDANFVTTNLFSTDWIISIFLSIIPIDLTHIYLDLFFEQSWDVCYETAISILTYYEQDLLGMHDAGQIIGQIKQARLGCEHLLMFGSSVQSSTYRKGGASLNQITTMRESEAIGRNSGIPFSVINLLQGEHEAENVKSSVMDDSRSDFLQVAENDIDIKSGKGIMRAHSLLSKNDKSRSNQKPKPDLEKTPQGSKSNAMLMKNAQMWDKILGDVKEKSLKIQAQNK